MTGDHVFQRIYRRNLWNGDESRSGPGSGTAATTNTRTAITDLVEQLGITSVLDVGCGDGFWMPELPGYVGIDVAPEAVRLARERNPGRTYQVRDIRSRPIGRSFDLVIARDVLQHMPPAEGRELIDAIRRTGSAWLLASTFVAGYNVPIRRGEAYSPDLTAQPFDMGCPDRMIFDGWDYADPYLVRDEWKYLGLWRLR